jgi:hypothetical protein
VSESLSTGWSESRLSSSYSRSTTKADSIATISRGYLINSMFLLVPSIATALAIAGHDRSRAGCSSGFANVWSRCHNTVWHVTWNLNHVIVLEHCRRRAMHVSEWVRRLLATNRRGSSSEFRYYGNDSGLCTPSGRPSTRSTGCTSPDGSAGLASPQ